MGMVVQQTESWGLHIQFIWSILNFKSIQINEAKAMTSRRAYQNSITKSVVRPSSEMHQKTIAIWF